jgi:hypothetical protein
MLGFRVSAAVRALKFAHATSALTPRILNGSKDFFSCFFANPTKIPQFYLKVLQNTETPKLTKKSKNNKAKF